MNKYMTVKAKNLRAGDRFKFGGADCEIVRIRTNEDGGIIVEFYHGHNPYLVQILTLAAFAKIKVLPL